MGLIPWWKPSFYINRGWPTRQICRRIYLYAKLTAPNNGKPFNHSITTCGSLVNKIVQRFSRAGPRGRGREWATQGVHPLSWLLSNNRLEEVCSTLTKGTFSSRLLLSNQDKGCTPSVAHSLPLPLGPALLNLSIRSVKKASSCEAHRVERTQQEYGILTRIWNLKGK